MKPVFADTSYYIALLSEGDVYHECAIAWSKNLLGRTVVTEYVLVELGNGLCRSKYRSRYEPLVEHLLHDADTIFVPASETLFRQGLQLRSSTRQSLVDGGLPFIRGDEAAWADGCPQH